MSLQQPTKGLSIKQSDQGLETVLPTKSVGLSHLKDEVTFGLLPIGSVIPIMSHMSGVASLPASGVVQGGWMRCDGAAVPSGNALSGSVPDLTGSRFLMGSSGAGAGNNPLSGASGGNASNQVSLATVNLPSHDHVMTHSHGFALTANSGGGHGHSFSLTAAAQSWSGSVSGTTSPSGISTPSGSNNNLWHTSTGTLAPGDGSSAAFQSWSGSVSGSNNSSGVSGSVGGSDGTHSHSVSGSITNFTGNTNPTGSGTAFDVRPLYVTAVYLIRVR